VIKSKRRVDVRLGLEVVLVIAMVVIQLCQQGGIGRLWKF